MYNQGDLAIDSSMVGLDVLAIFNSTLCDPAWSFAECTTRQTTALTHGYHKYPAKFIPPLAAKLIEEYTSPGQQVCDPFMGSGTTLVEAVIRGRHAVGVDINPIAWVISRAKTMPIEPKLLKERLDVFFADLPTDASGHLISPLLGNVPSLNHERIDYWFTEPNRSELEVVLHLINQELDENLRLFLLCGFSNVLKNCSRWLMKSSKPTVDKNKWIPPLIPTLQKHLNYMEKRNLLFWNVMQAQEGPTSVKVQIGDARQLPVPRNSLDLIVTSPPYVTSYEYADLHQLSNIVLGFTAQPEENNERLLSPLAIATIDELKRVDKGEARGVLAYFQAMQQCIQEMYTKLRPGGRTCIVIGNTTLRKVPIRNAEIFAETGVCVGFTFDRLIRREIPSKILPQTRDPKTGKFTSAGHAEALAYPEEFILVLKK
ncbi:MAG: hypothetical protein HPY81_11175 [Firmicutes bacterium]|nr:hypothetical protein [Bacillota bacterium]